MSYNENQDDQILREVDVSSSVNKSIKQKKKGKVQTITERPFQEDLILKKGVKILLVSNYERFYVKY